MKTNQLLINSLAITLFGCSVLNTPTATPPLPPRNLNSSAPTALIQPTKSTDQSVTPESQVVYKRRQITEDRGPGGSVNKIMIDNAGTVPDYYLYPAERTQYNTNDNPDRLSVPNWQINW